MVAAKDIYGNRYRGAKLELEQVRQARTRLASGESQRSVARDYGVSQVSVSRLANGKRWGKVK